MNYGWDERVNNRRSTMWKLRRSTLFAIATTLGLLGFIACSDINEEGAPVELIATIVEQANVYDILNPPELLGEIELRARVKREDPTSTRFLDVQLESYRVTFVRTDGGTQVPPSFVRATSGLIPATGSATPGPDLLIFEPGTFTQAPFAALLPQNGGVDPETGQRIVKLDVVIDIYGETLSGEDVSARTRMPITFCAGCTL